MRLRRALSATGVVSSARTSASVSSRSKVRTPSGSRGGAFAWGGGAFAEGGGVAFVPVRFSAFFRAARFVPPAPAGSARPRRAASPASPASPVEETCLSFPHTRPQFFWCGIPFRCLQQKWGARPTDER